MDPREQERFDRLLEDVLETLPPRVRRLLDEISLVVMDRPTPDMIDELRRDGLLVNEDGTESDGSDLCGLHTGAGLMERPENDTGLLPDQVHIFRDGIVSLALEEEGLDWDSPDADERVYEEIRITVLHEIGHHYGLDEDDLDELGYA
ncbi:MAG: metallopeptidase family protein [Phycisphaerales bacterium]